MSNHLYNNVRPLPPTTDRKHINNMILFTKWISPIGRTRGLNLITSLYTKSLNTTPYTLVNLNQDTSFCFPTFDSYWGYYIYNQRTYEESLGHVFNSIKDMPFTFIDCGANYGYWSALLSSEQMGSHPTVAVEASKETYKVLQKTLNANQQRFKCLHLAISDVDNKDLQFTDRGGHAGRHIIDGKIEKLKVNNSMFRDSSKPIETIKSISLDSLVFKYAPNATSYVVKLDVEGAEIDAFHGAKKLSEQDTIFLYEDYGGDKESVVTQKLLEMNYEIYFPTDNGLMQLITKREDAKKTKTNPRLGYNFIALKGEGRLKEKIRNQYSQPKKRILHLTTGLDTGGTEMMIFKVTATMDKNKYWNSILYFKPAGALTYKFTDTDTVIQSLNIKHPFQFVYKFFIFIRMVKHFNPDIIQGWLVHGNLAATLAKLFFPKVKVYWNIRHTLDGVKNEKLHTRALIYISRFLSSIPERIIYNSKTSLSQHINYGYNKSTSAIIPNGFDTDLFKPRQEAKKQLLDDLQLPQEVFLIGIVARYHPVKAHHIFIEAAHQLLEEGYNAHFILVGKKVTYDNPAIQKHMNKPHLKKHFSFLGERKDIPNIVASLDIATLSSSWGEAFPNSIGEAMSAGVICVATDVGDCKEIVGNVGVIVPPESPQDLKKAWIQILTMPTDRRQSLKQLSRQNMLHDFSIESIVKRYEAIYR